MQHLPKAIDEAGNRNHFHENHWKRVGIDLLKHHLGDLAGLSLLDYGCGRGETLRLAAECGMQAQGTDLDPECVAISRAHGEAVVLASCARYAATIDAAGQCTVEPLAPGAAPAW